MFIGIDQNRVVRLHSRTRASIPGNLQIIELNEEQVQMYANLPMPVEQVLFVDGAFSTIPAPDKALAIDAIQRIESENPITHRASREETLGVDFILRALRDKINALDAEVAQLADRAAQPLPEIPVSHLLQVVKAVDDLIKAERTKL